MAKKVYKAPLLKVSLANADEVIRTSGEEPTAGQDLEAGWNDAWNNSKK